MGWLLRCNFSAGLTWGQPRLDSPGRLFQSCEVFDIFAPPFSKRTDFLPRMQKSGFLILNKDTGAHIQTEKTERREGGISKRSYVSLVTPVEGTG